MPVYVIKAVQKIPVSLEDAWAFFSSPVNLAAITPASMNFKIISVHHGGSMYPGQIIEYKLTPVLGIPVYWMTEITHVDEGRFFVDEQRFGPYKMWHHQHHFVPVEGGVEMTDIVHYKNPGWIFGRLANWLFVKKQLGKIFQYRKERIEERFGVYQHPK